MTDEQLSALLGVGGLAAIPAAALAVPFAIPAGAVLGAGSAALFAADAFGVDILDDPSQVPSDIYRSRAESHIAGMGLRMFEAEFLKEQRLNESLRRRDRGYGVLADVQAVFDRRTAMDIEYLLQDHMGELAAISQPYTPSMAELSLMLGV